MSRSGFSLATCLPSASREAGAVPGAGLPAAGTTDQAPAPLTSRSRGRAWVVSCRGAQWAEVSEAGLPRWWGLLFYGVLRSHLTAKGTLEQGPEGLEKTMWISGKKGSREQGRHTQRSCGLVYWNSRGRPCARRRGEQVGGGVRGAWSTP